ncbi:MAG: [protein-PII] uridylyltransferase [Deltaproteobacteria bacterium]|nr:[protein-PII] uridylyltransferase [Deltaproteobacteria bacterium]
MYCRRGYGRKELNIHSDIDLIILFEKRIPSEAKTLATEVFYPLWDLGIELGYAVRSVKECLKLCQNDFEVMTSMMDARFICGDSPLYLSFMEGLRNKVIQRKKALWFRWLEERHRIRKEIYGDAGYLLEPHVKEGIGGLRDYHHLLWVSKAFFELDSARDLEYMGKLSHNEYIELREALGLIWQVRNHLHQLSGRNNDRLGFEYQKKIADRLGFEGKGDVMAVEQFMGKVHTAMIFLKELHRSFVTAHLPEKGRKPAFSRADELAESLHVHRGEIEFDSATAILSDPALLTRIFEEGARLRIPLSMAAKRLVKEFLYLVDDAYRRQPSVVAAFMAILKGPGTFESLEQMFETGFLEALFPEFEPIKERVLFDAYHIYPVGRHSIETVRCLKDIGRGETDILLVDMMSEMDDPGPLFLAGLFHDIGKTRADHDIKGAEIASAILERMGWGPEAREDVMFLIRNHLLLMKTATRRDLGEEKVVVQCARKMGDIKRLKMLYLLTWADAKATGPRAWNEWTAKLLIELFFKVLHILEKGELATMDAAKQVEETMEILGDMLSREGLETDPDALFAIMSPRYVLNCAPRDMAGHIQMVQDLNEKVAKKKGGTFRLDVQENESESCFEMTVISHDRPGLFADIAGVLALHHIDIFEANIYTWRDGTAVDLFKVTPPPDPLRVREVWEKIEQDMKRAFTGKLGLTYRLEEKDASSLLSKRPGPSQPPVVHLNNRDSDFFTLIEVFADDRIGLLHMLARTLFELRLDIRVAKITTKANRITDVFYVRDLEGQKIEDTEQLKEIKDALEHRLSEG